MAWRTYLALAKIAAKTKKDPTPEIVDHCAARLVKDEGYRKRNAYAICVKQFQRYGILKKHKMELTEKGRRMSQKHYQHRRAIDLHRVP